MSHNGGGGGITASKSEVDVRPSCSFIKQEYRSLDLELMDLNSVVIFHFVPSAVIAA